MYFDTIVEYEREFMDNLIDSEMHNQIDQAHRLLGSMIVHPSISIKDFAMTLAYAWMDSQTSAETIANELGLGKLDFIAIMEDFDAYKEEWLKNYELAQNF